jgi:ABC-type multidrug transport system ATPase subunit
MELSIQRLSKTYRQAPVFSDISFHVPAGSRLAITGPNGSGKSTLLKILSGGALPSSGQVTYKLGHHPVDPEDVFRHVHFVAPYNTVIEELSPEELYDLHRGLGMLRAFPRYRDWAARLAYPFRPDQPVKSFSSGMKQRIRLGLALLDDRPLVLLDEPGSNLDRQGKDWMFSLIGECSAGQTIIIATNDEEEAAVCGSCWRMTD